MAATHVYGRCNHKSCGAPTRAAVLSNDATATVQGLCPDGHPWVAIVDTRNATVSAATGIHPTDVG